MGKIEWQLSATIVAPPPSRKCFSDNLQEHFGFMMGPMLCSSTGHLSSKMAEPPEKKNLSQVIGGSSETRELATPRARSKSSYGGPNEEFLKLLLNLGISQNAAEKVNPFIITI